MSLFDIKENIKLSCKVLRLENKLEEQERLIQSLKDTIEYIYRQKEYFRELANKQNRSEYTMTDNEVLDLLQRKHIPLSIDQAIEILETKATWCDHTLEYLNESGRLQVEATTLREATAIVKRVSQKPVFYSNRTKVVKDYFEWADKNNAAICFENFLAYLDIIGLIKESK